MVSEKLVIVLITLAILMSIASIALTISSLNTEIIPEIKAQPQNIAPATEHAVVGVTIAKSPGATK